MKVTLTGAYNEYSEGDGPVFVKGEEIVIGDAEGKRLIEKGIVTFVDDTQPAVEKLQVKIVADAGSSEGQTASQTVTTAVKTDESKMIPPGQNVPARETQHSTSPGTKQDK